MIIKQNSSTSSKLRVAIIIFVPLALLIGYIYYAHHYQKWPFLPDAVVENPYNTVNYEKPSDDQVKTGASIKEQVADQSKNNSSDQDSPIVMDITAATKTPDDVVMIRTLIQKNTNSGNCILSMTGPNNSSYTETVAVQATASTATCQGFNIPMSKLSSGDWTITINFKDDANTATATKKITL